VAIIGADILKLIIHRTCLQGGENKENHKELNELNEFLTNPYKQVSKRTSISDYIPFRDRSVSGKRGPEFVRSADTCPGGRCQGLQSLPRPNAAALLLAFRSFASLKTPLGFSG